MLEILKDTAYFILGIAAFYFLFFGAFSDKKNNEQDESSLVRVWMTYIALAILSLGAIAWLLNYAFHRFFSL